MKKVFLAIAVVAVFTACNNSGDADAAKTDSPAVTAVDSTLKVADSTVKVADSTVVATAEDKLEEKK